MVGVNLFVGFHVSFCINYLGLSLFRIITFRYQGTQQDRVLLFRPTDALCLLTEAKLKGAQPLLLLYSSRQRKLNNRFRGRPLNGFSSYFPYTLSDRSDLI